MLRPITTTVGSTLAALCLVSTLAMAQSPSSTPSQYPTQPEPYQSQPQYPAQPMTPQYGNTAPQQGHRQQPAQSEMQYPSQPQYPAQPMTPQYGNTMPQQGHRQQPAQSEMRYPSERQAMRMICIKDNGKGNCVAARGADGREIVVVGEGLKSGAYMTCVDRGNMVDCDPAS
jgi:hypothetical protein